MCVRACVKGLEVFVAEFYDLQAVLGGQEGGNKLWFSSRLVETGGQRVATGRDFDSNGTFHSQVPLSLLRCHRLIP